ncbi:hypothetical protein ABBQ32_004846 [Trebouxia sp. C0010 RCD-2024]
MCEPQQIAVTGRACWSRARRDELGGHGLNASAQQPERRVWWSAATLDKHEANLWTPWEPELGWSSYWLRVPRQTLSQGPHTVGSSGSSTSLPRRT